MPSRSKPKGSWKKDPAKRDRFIERALRQTLASQHDIAKRVGIHSSKVSDLNKSKGIRSKSQSKEIRYASLKSKRFDLFSRSEKTKLVAQNSGGITEQVKVWWAKSSLIRTEFGSLADFVNEAKGFAFERLDFYDPSRSTKPSTFIINSAKFFGKKTNGDLLRAGRSKTTFKRFRIEPGTRKPPTLAEIKRAVSVLSVSSRHFIKELGINERAMFEVGPESARDFIWQIAGTALEASEQNFVHARLFGGKTLNDVAKSLSVNRTTATSMQSQIIGKLKKQLRKAYEG